MRESSADPAMSVADAKATIRQGTRVGEETRRILEKVNADASDADSLARLTTHDSGHQEVAKGLASLQEALHEVELTMRRLDACTIAANEYLAALG
jgi:hypothetical protein